MTGHREIGRSLTRDPSPHNSRTTPAVPRIAETRCISGTQNIAATAHSSLNEMHVFRLGVRELSGLGELRPGFSFGRWILKLGLFPQIHQLDAGLTRHGQGLLVAIELAVVDTGNPRVGDQLETGPAGTRGRVELRSRDGDAVARGLDDRVGLRVHGRDAVLVLDDAAHVFAVRQSSRGTVVTGREDRPVARDDRADMFAGTCRARRYLARDVHEVRVPVHPVGHRRDYARWP